MSNFFVTLLLQLLLERSAEIVSIIGSSLTTMNVLRVH